MSIVAGLLTAWVVWRCLGVVAGLVRLRRFEGPTRHEARRTVIGYAAITIFLAVAALYLWAVVADLQPTETMTGLLAAVVMISLAIGLAARLMQPPARLPHTVGVCRLLYPNPETRIEPAGTVMRPDETGAYQPTVIEVIQAPFDDAVRHYVRLVLEELGERVHSIYVRGSIAAGTAVPGSADLDGVVVLHAETRIDTGLRGRLERALEGDHPAVDGIELHTIGFDLVGADEGRNPHAFLLATQSVCIHGPDLTAELPRFGFGPWAFTHAPHLAGEIERLGSELLEESAEERRRSCIWIMRRIVRTGFEAVMAEEDTFTRSLYASYEAFRRHHPERADEMWRALELAIEPTDDIEVITELCAGLGAWVAAEASEVYQRALEAVRTSAEPPI